ncbi:MAG TPA: tetratricopeptide repeat protein [Pirellulales bacterium]|nr:tetratricopeptide repeat protein [Pirellulales bacterium]
MKTERRHELATNDLADWIGDKLEELKPYSTAIWATVLAAIVLVFAAIYWSRKSEAKLEQGWDQYFQARTQETVDELRDLADANPKSPAGLWARATLGDRRLSEGVNLLFEDRAEGQQALTDAVEAYEYVLQNAPSGSLLAERATFGLGEAFESQNELDQARAQYEALQSKWPGGAFSAEAERRLADLDRATTKSFYDWFAKQEPKRKPAASKLMPDKTPDFDFGKIEEHPFQPQIGLDSKTFGGQDLGAEKSKKKAGAEEASPEKPGGEKAGSEKPTAEEPAAEEKGAKEKGAKAPTDDPSDKPEEAGDEPAKDSAAPNESSAAPNESKE